MFTPVLLVLCTAAGATVQMQRVATVPWCRNILARGQGLDLDQDGALEFVLQRGSPPSSFLSRLEFYESAGNDSFVFTGSLDLSHGFTNLPFAIPRGAGDSDGDRLGELVVFGRTSGRHLRIYESTSPNGYPTTTPVWEAPGWSGNISGGRIADTDRDGKQEIVFGGLAPGALEYGVTVFENDGDNAYVQTYLKSLMWEQQSLLVMSDLDGDGRDEIVYTGPGVVFMIEAVGDDTYQETAMLQLVYTSDGEWVSATVLEDGGDLDGDGRKEFLVGGLKSISPGSDPPLNVLFLFEAVGNDAYQIVATFTRPFDLDSKITATIGDVDGDGTGEIVIAVHTDITVYKNTGDNAWTPIWVGDTIHFTNWATGAGDHDGDGKEEILFREVDDTTGIFEIDPLDAVDLDGDGFVDAIDNCPAEANAGQEDTDADGVGDACDNCVYASNPSQGSAVLGQSIVAADAQTFAWGAPAEVVYARGHLSSVGSYGVEVVQTLPLGSTLVDATQPVPGAGFYYVLRPDCPTGSWQTAAGAEPERDAALP